MRNAKYRKGEFKRVFEYEISDLDFYFIENERIMDSKTYNQKSLLYDDL
jgi:hypothetical protein